MLRPAAWLVLVASTTVALGGCPRPSDQGVAQSLRQPGTGGSPSRQACPKSCTAVADCDCGREVASGECALGRKECIDPSRPCPDFCSGIAGQLRLACVDGQCRLVSPAPSATASGTRGGGGRGQEKCSQSCSTTSDCDCGRDVASAECALGRKECIDPSRPCPDFCGGIAGQLRLACVDGQCRLVSPAPERR
jgi:hypothetical protein